MEDTGEGIAADQLPSLFEPFRQTASGIKAQEGTGLGLSISRQFVRLMGGDIRVRSVAGQGTLFAFDVQLAPAELAEVAAAPAERRVIGIAPDPSTGSGQATQREYRMLVVDDKRENRRLLVEWLQAAGFVVREAANGQEAIEIWEDWSPQMIWMDVRMPVLDGYEATRRIKASLRGQATVIIALTASAFEHEQEIVRAAGCDDVVRKPVREATIFAKIAEHLGIRFVYEDPPACRRRRARGRAATGRPGSAAGRMAGRPAPGRRRGRYRAGRRSDRRAFASATRRWPTAWPTWWPTIDSISFSC